MIGSGQGVDTFAEAIRLAIVAQKPRPFAAFRGGYRRPMSNRRKVRGAPVEADMRRVFAMSIVPDRSSNIAKLQRGLRIIARIKAAEAIAAGARNRSASRAMRSATGSSVRPSGG